MYFFWQLFEDAPRLAQALSALQLAFTIWMMIDAYGRGAEFFWYWVILLFQPAGAWIYFFVIKLRTMRWPGRRAGLAARPRLSLDELRYRVERTPTVANRIALAEKLMEKQAHREAMPLLEAVLAIEPGYCPALHALAECRLAAGEAEQAVAPLEKLVSYDPRWSNYRAWRTFIEVHQARGKAADALAACRELTKRVPTMENKCLLANHLLDNEMAPEAVKLLDDALADYHYSPWGARLRNWTCARQARRLLSEAENAETKNVGPA
jgi:hypothetical protein